jgi:hypothetical protein
MATQDSKQNLEDMKIVEKYLKIDDFIEHIIRSKDGFVPEESIVQSIEEQMRVKGAYILKFMLQIQDVINFDKTVKMMISYNIHAMLIENLFEQTD